MYPSKLRNHSFLPFNLDLSLGEDVLITLIWGESHCVTWDTFGTRKSPWQAWRKIFASFAIYSMHLHHTRPFEIHQTTYVKKVFHFRSHRHLFMLESIEPRRLNRRLTGCSHARITAPTYSFKNVTIIAPIIKINIKKLR